MALNSLESGGRTPIEQVLDRARWAPSGDNTQPWRFQFVSPLEAVVHTFDTRRHCVYDLTGAPSQIGVGALLETARIAATALGMRAEILRVPTSSDENLQYAVQLVPDESVAPSALCPFIETRCTHRRPYSRQPLTAEQKAALEASVAPEYSVLWLEGASRWAMAKLLFESARIRLTIKEAFDVHAGVIEWHARTSETKIPDQAVGLDPVTLAIMRWAMRSWRRTRILSTYFAGTLLPRLQLDLLPALGCAAHVVICASAPARQVDDYIRAGSAVQRFWLTAERMGLRHQPEMTPLIFAGYHREGRPFSAHPRAFEWAGRLHVALDSQLGDAAPRAVWMGRIGVGKTPESRSVRRSLAELRLG